MNCDPERMQYMRDMKGYCKSLLLPGFAFFEEQKGAALPKHLAEVSRLRSSNCSDHNCLVSRLQLSKPQVGVALPTILSMHCIC